MDKHEVTWRIIPENAPAVFRHCSKCNRKMSFYCSEKFRLNGNHHRIDVWLIYKCSKCDNTWKLTLMRGIKPHELEPELFDKLTNNDKDLAWKYAFERQLLKRNDCEIDYSCVDYAVDGFNKQDVKGSLLVHLKSQYVFDLKLSAFLAGRLGVSVGSVKKLAGRGLITSSLGYDIMKYRIRADLDLQFEFEGSDVV